jgi:hypothetical protein
MARSRTRSGSRSGAGGSRQRGPLAPPDPLDLRDVDLAYAEEWKFDHGIMVPLHFLTPRYDLPVIPGQHQLPGPAAFAAFARVGARRSAAPRVRFGPRAHRDRRDRRNLALARDSRLGKD